MEYRFLARDGRVVWVRDHCHVVAGDDGHPIHRMGVLIDLTPSKEAEQALRESEARYRQLLEQSPAPSSS